MKSYRKFGGIALLALLAACGGGGEEGSGGVTAEESQQLNEAAEMLDSNATLVPADETGLANAGGPAETGGLIVTDEAATNAQ